VKFDKMIQKLVLLVSNGFVLPMDTDTRNLYSRPYSSVIRESRY
jgi:hypothetical protein